MHKVDILRITTVSISLSKLLDGQVDYMQSKGLNVATASFGDYDFEHHYPIPSLRRSISPVRDLIALIQLYVLIKKLKPAIVHTHTPKAGLLGMLASKMAGVESRIHTVAGMPLMSKSGILKIILVWMEKLTYAAATHVWPNSYGLRDFIANNIYKGEKLDVIGKGTSNGIDLDYFNSSQVSQDSIVQLKKEIGLTKIVLLFIGRLVSDKGVNELIEAFQKVSLENKEVSLLLVGSEEPDLDPLLEQTKNIIVRSSKIFSVGFHQDVRTFIAASDILVFPSYREGFPNVPLQCGAFGKPLVLTDINGCNEIVPDESMGLLVPVANAQYLSEAICKLLADDGKRYSMGHKVQKHIKTNFEQSVVWAELYSRYSDILN